MYRSCLVGRVENFSGKIIIPFCTHAGSGIGGTENFIAETTNTKVLQGLEVRGTVAQNDKIQAQIEIENWLKNLKF